MVISKNIALLRLKEVDAIVQDLRGFIETNSETEIQQRHERAQQTLEDMRVFYEKGGGFTGGLMARDIEKLQAILRGEK